MLLRFTGTLFVTRDGLPRPSGTFVELGDRGLLALGARAWARTVVRTRAHRGAHSQLLAIG